MTPTPLAEAFLHQADETPEIAAILEALAAGPTPGPWKLDGKSFNRLENLTGIYVAFHEGGRICEAFANCLVNTDAQLHANGRLIAACNPTAITAVLAHFDAALKARDAEIARLRDDAERTARNRDMWKGQCERQADELAKLRDDARQGEKASNFEAIRARTLLAHLWRRYDAAGTSMGRSHEAVVLEAALSLLGDPDPADMALLDKDSGDLVNETRTYLSSKMAARLFGHAALQSREGKGAGDADQA